MLHCLMTTMETQLNKIEKEEIVYFLLPCLFETVWFLLPNLEDFDLSELLD